MAGASQRKPWRILLRHILQVVKARFLWLITHSFGGKGDSFGTSQKQGVSSLQNRLERVRELSRRLDRVVIENLDYTELIQKYDHPDNFFYCDPPYTTGYTYANSKRFSHEALRDVLGQVKGRWILSYNDDPMIHELYKGFQIKQVTRAKGINRKEGKMDYAEVIIANFPLEEQC